MAVLVEFIKHIKTIRIPLNSDNKEGIYLIVRHFRRDEISKELHEKLIEIADYCEALSEDGTLIYLNHIDVRWYREHLKELEEEGYDVRWDYAVLKTIEEWQKEGIDFVEVI